MRTASFALKFLERNAKSPCFSRAFFVTSIAYQYWKGSDNFRSITDLKDYSIAYQYWKGSDNLIFSHVDLASSIAYQYWKGSDNNQNNPAHLV